MVELEKNIEDYFPKLLTVKNGKIAHIDNKSVIPYINRWIKENDIKDGENLSVVLRKIAVQDALNSHKYRLGIACNFCGEVVLCQTIQSSFARICKNCVDECSELIKN